MNAHLLTKPLVSLFAPLLLVGAAQAATYTTVFDGADVDVTINNSLGTTWTIAYIEVTWSTSVAEGSPVGAADLSDLSFSLYDPSNALLYLDNAIVGGVVQPIGGTPRTLGAIVFDAISGPGEDSVQDLDNDLEQVQFSSASGTTFNIYSSAFGGDFFINLAAYRDGGLQDDATFTVASQSTTAIPEPSSYTALAGLFSLGLVAVRRKRA